MATQGQEGMDGGQGLYPERPGEPDCMYYLRLGLCWFGMTCRFNHPPSGKLVAQGNGDSPERFGQPECQYYLKTGTCKFGATCKFHHRREKTGSTGRVHLNVFGLPMRQEECTYYMRTWSCQYGFTCKFHHLQPAMIGALVSLPQYGSGGGGPSSGTAPQAMMPVPEWIMSMPGPWNTYQIAEVYTACVPERMDSRFDKAIGHSQPTTTCEISEYHTAEGMSCGTENHDTGPCRPSSKYFSAHDVVQSIERCKTEPNRELEREIEASKVHWSELSSNCDSDGDGESNREIYERLRLLPKYQSLLNIYDVNSIDDIVVGQKLAEGGQAEIFEADCGNKLGRDGRHVLKVFKEGYSLRDLQFQWPEGILPHPLLSFLNIIWGDYVNLIRGGMVLEDDRFAFLLLRCGIDLRKLIDLAQDDNSPLWKGERGPSVPPLMFFNTYEPQTRQHGHSMPIFKDRCAHRIMYHIAWEMTRLHEKNVLHRDLKASNILCDDYGYHHNQPGRKASKFLSNDHDSNYDQPGQTRRISLYVADYESSIGVVGTAFWRAPEILQQLKERKPKVHFTREADVYSYAMTCYEVLTGRIPFEAYKTSDYDDVLNGMRPTLPDHVPTWVKDLIHRCWHQNPSERPTFRAIMEEIRSCAFVRPLENYFFDLEGPDRS